MVGEELLNTDQIISSFWKNMPPELSTQVNLIIKLVVILVGISIAYIVVSLLIKLFQAIFGTREARRLKNIGEQLDQIIRFLGKGKGKDEKKIDKDEKKGKK